MIQIHLEEILSYSFCPLRHRFLKGKDRHKNIRLPIKTVYAHLLRDAVVFSLGRSQGMGMAGKSEYTRKRFAEQWKIHVGSVAGLLMDETMPKNPESHVLSVVSSTHAICNMSDDPVAEENEEFMGIKVPWSLQIDKDIEIYGYVDAVFISPRKLRIFSVDIYNEDKNSLRYQIMNTLIPYAFIQETGIPNVVTTFLNPWSGKTNNYTYQKNDKIKIGKMVRGIARSIKDNVKYPTQSSCSLCPYTESCLSSVDTSKRGMSLVDIDKNFLKLQEKMKDVEDENIDLD